MQRWGPNGMCRVTLYVCELFFQNLFVYFITEFLLLPWKLLHEADLLDQQARTTEGSKIEKLRFTTKYHMPFSNFLVELKKEYGSGNIETGFKKFTRIMAERGGARAVMSVYAITS